MRRGAARGEKRKPPPGAGRRRAPLRFVVVAALILPAAGCLPTEAPLPGPSATAVPAVLSAEPSAEPLPRRSVNWRFAAEISAPDRAALVSAGDADVAHIERRFARRFETPPEVVVVASEASFARSLSETFGLDAKTAALFAGRYNAYTGTSSATRGEATIVHWPKMAKERPIFRLRHELSHAMIRKLTALSNELPTWLNEGLAELEGQSVPGLSWTLLQSRYCAASMAATNTLLPLERLTNPEEAFPLLADQIANATESVRLLESDVTRAAVLRILERLAQRDRFEEAFRTATGMQFSRFTATLSPRLRALAPGYPGIATAPADPSGPGLTYVIYGFAPSSPVNVLFRGNGLQAQETRNMSAHGCSAGNFTGAWPTGTYEITAIGDSGTVRVTARKEQGPPSSSGVH